MVSSTLAWESLYRNSRTVVKSDELNRMARRLEMDPDHVTRHLRRAGYITPLFKGYYYVRSPEEVRLGNPRHNPLELFALAADAKGIGGWYFGLHTALALNGLTHESRNETSVISTKLYRIKGVRMAGRRFVVHRWSPELFGFGIVERGRIRYSDPEKTVLDFAYWDMWREAKGHAPTSVWREHLDAVDGRRLRRYLAHYPPTVGDLVEASA